MEAIVAKVKNVKNPLLALLREKVTDPVSNGPFVLKEWNSGDYLLLEKNEHFFGQGKEISGHLLGPYIDGIIYKVFGTTDAAILALLKGSIDMFLVGASAGLSSGPGGRQKHQDFHQREKRPLLCGI